MINKLEKFLTENKVNSDSILQAAKILCAEETDYLSPEEMKSELILIVDDENEVEKSLREIENNLSVIDTTSLAYLSVLAEETSEAEDRVIEVLESSGKSLPVIETGIIAITVMYISYLLITGGVKKETEVLERKSDGTLIKKKSKELFGPTGPLSSIGKLFSSPQ